MNDRFGHAVGDEVLRSLADFLIGALCEGDHAYRLGGEEFLVVLDQAGEGAAMAAERLCSGWRARAPVTTFSGGVSVHLAGATAEQTLERTDAALYEAKNAGRDRIALAD